MDIKFEAKQIVKVKSVHNERKPKSESIEFRRNQSASGVFFSHGKVGVGETKRVVRP
jgi:hypothetical protein